MNIKFKFRIEYLQLRMLINSCLQFLIMNAVNNLMNINEFFSAEFCLSNCSCGAILLCRVVAAHAHSPPTHAPLPLCIDRWSAALSPFAPQFQVYQHRRYLTHSTWICAPFTPYTNTSNICYRYVHMCILLFAYRNLKNINSVAAAIWWHSVIIN